MEEQTLTDEPTNAVPQYTEEPEAAEVIDFPEVGGPIEEYYPEEPGVEAAFVRPDPIIMVYIPGAGQAALSVENAKSLVAALVPEIAKAEAIDG